VKLSFHHAIFSVAQQHEKFSLRSFSFHIKKYFFLLIDFYGKKFLKIFMQKPDAKQQFSLG